MEYNIKFYGYGLWTLITDYGGGLYVTFGDNREHINRKLMRSAQLRYVLTCIKNVSKRLPAVDCT